MRQGVNPTVLLNALPPMTCCADVDGPLTFDDHDLLAFTGRTAADRRGVGFAEVIRPADRDDVLQGWEAAWLGARTFTGECRLVRHDGRACWVRNDARPLLTQAGALTGWIGTRTLTSADGRTLALQGVGEALQAM